jgi:hypothetical protein
MEKLKVWLEDELDRGIIHKIHQQVVVPKEQLQKSSKSVKSVIALIRSKNKEEK